MKQAKKQKLLDAGYRVTDTQEFLGLSDSEAAIIELKIAKVRRRRPAKHRAARIRRVAAGSVDA